MLNGISAARLNFLKSPAMTTSPILDSQACAPKAGPLDAIELRTQTIVEAA